MSRLEVITGPMFSGKSEEVIRRLVRLSFAKKRILVVGHIIDTRPARNIFGLVKANPYLKQYSHVTTSGVKTEEHFDSLLATSDYQVVAIDEAHFFGDWLPSAVGKLLDQHTGHDFHLIIAGLDMDFAKNPFRSMPELLALADEVLKLTAICTKCRKNPANLTYKVGGSLKTQVEVGDNDIYEARCRQCHALPD